MHSRRTRVISLVLLTTGIIGGTLGMLSDHETIGRLGWAATLAGIPLLICHTIRAAHVQDEQALTDAHTAGYRLALEHVARGLLDPPAAPRPGPRGTPDTNNVIVLRPPEGADDDGDHRKAQ